MTRPAARAFFVAIAAVGLVAAGAAGMYLFSPAVPPTLAAPAPATSAPAIEREFADEYQADVRLFTTPSAAIISPAEGRVTRFDCVPGAQIVSGGSTLSIDGRPRLDLAMDAPLWRDISQDDRGDDVRALQEALLALGYPLTVDGVAGDATFSAAQEALRSIGADLQDVALSESGDIEAQGEERKKTIIALADIVWLTADEVRVTECLVPTGAVVTSGDELAHSPEQVISAQLAFTPDQTAPGARTLTVAGLTTQIEADGQINDEAFFATLVGTAEYASAVPEERSVTLHGTVALADPLTVFAVPAAALFGVDGTTGCVSIDDEPVSIEVVGSELGQTLVVPTSDRPFTYVDLAPSSEISCD